MVQKEGRFKIGLKRIKKWLQNIESYSLNKAVRKTYKKNRVVTTGINDQWDADLADYQKLSRHNDEYTFLLVAVDLFSRFALVQPLKKKTNAEVIAGFRRMFRERGVPRAIRTDAGKEFTAREMDKFYEDTGVIHFITLNEVKANYAERLIKTLKSKLWRYMVENNTLRYIDRLQDLVNSYNATEHSTIDLPPEQVDEEEEKGLWWSQYAPEHPYVRGRGEVSFKYKKGDYVRIPTLAHAFTREYDQHWTGEVFVVDEAFVRDGVILYRLVDQNGELILGTFYESELQQVDPSQRKYWKIERVLEQRGDQSLVRWRFWPDTFDSWISTRDIDQYR